LVGNFNAHLQNAAVVFADEAFWAGDKAGEGVLKAMITEDVICIERKGHDVISIPNHIHLIVASNHDWVVPAGLEERRFCILEVSASRMQDHPYFADIAQQMANGGREAFLKFLLDYNLNGINLRIVPQTEALIDNKTRSMSSSENFWYEVLQKGSLLPFQDNSLQPYHTEWTGIVKKAHLHDRYIEHAKKIGHSRRSTETELGKALNKLCPAIRTVQTTTDHGRLSEWHFPDLATCRQLFDQALKWEGHVWPEVEGDAPRTAPERKYSDPPRFSPPIANWSDYEGPVEPGRPPSGQGFVPQATNIQGENRPAEPA
jgi:hypothetical protein